MSSIAARFPDKNVNWGSQILVTGPLHVGIHPVSRKCGLVCNSSYFSACQKCSKTGHIPGVFPLGVAYLSSALVGNLAEGLDRSPQTVTIQLTESFYTHSTQDNGLEFGVYEFRYKHGNVVGKQAHSCFELCMLQKSRD